MQLRARLRAATLAAVFLILPSCASLDKAAGELTPYGAQLNERIAEWDRACKSMKLGPYYDNDPSKRGDATCNFLFLKDKRWDPNADEFSRYAHAFALPAPHDKPQVAYRNGMGSGAYLKELCEKEAGEWIFRTVSNVEGILQARTMVPNPPGLNRLTPFAKEPLVSGSAGDGLWRALGERNAFDYAYFEYPEKVGDGSVRILRFYRDEQHLVEREPAMTVHWRTHLDKRIPYVVATHSRAPYAFVGRGTTRSELEENGIVGFELLVVDTRSKEVLGFRRTFVSTRPAPLSLGRLHQDTVGDFCKSDSVDPYAPKFVVRVAQPR